MFSVVGTNFEQTLLTLISYRRITDATGKEGGFVELEKERRHEDGEEDRSTAEGILEDDQEEGLKLTRRSGIEGVVCNFGEPTLDCDEITLGNS